MFVFTTINRRLCTNTTTSLSSLLLNTTNTSTRGGRNHYSTILRRSISISNKSPLMLYCHQVQQQLLPSSSSSSSSLPLVSSSSSSSLFYNNNNNNSHNNNIRKRWFSFNFAGPRKLDEILKKELVADKSSTEVADIWYTYHETKENVHGLVLKGDDAKDLLSRAAASPFFIQPVFRDDGYFMMISQFQEPGHFFMAYLEDYKMDPSGAQPLLTFSIFDDYSEDKNLILIRVDILNKGIGDDEGYKLVQNMLDVYINDDEYMTVNAFNKKPETFDFDDYISRQNAKWRSGGDGGSGSGSGSGDNNHQTIISENTNSSSK